MLQSSRLSQRTITTDLLDVREVDGPAPLARVVERAARVRSQVVSRTHVSRFKSRRSRVVHNTRVENDFAGFVWEVWVNAVGWGPDRSDSDLHPPLPSIYVAGTSPYHSQITPPTRLRRA